MADQTRAESRVADIFLGEDFFLFVCLIFATRGRDSFCHVTLYSGKRHDDDCLFWVEIKKKKKTEPIKTVFFSIFEINFYSVLSENILYVGISMFSFNNPLPKYYFSLDLDHEFSNLMTG